MEGDQAEASDGALAPRRLAGRPYEGEHFRRDGQARRLGDLPPARYMRAVLREAGGCAYIEVRAADGWRIEPAGVARRKAEPAR